MREGTGYWLLREVSVRPDVHGVPVRQGSVVHGDGAKVDALPPDAGFEREGSVFYGSNLDGALRHATIAGLVGHVPTTAGPSIPEPEHVEVTYGTPEAEQALRAAVAVAYETSDALGVRYGDVHLLVGPLRAGHDLTVRSQSVDAPGLWPEEPDDAETPSP